MRKNPVKPPFSQGMANQDLRESFGGNRAGSRLDSLAGTFFAVLKLRLQAPSGWVKRTIDCRKTSRRICRRRA